MKKSIFILFVVLLISCKKEKMVPVNNSTQSVCQNYSPILSGKYVSQIYPHYDTIEVVFNRSNCPVNSNNIYTIKKLGEAVDSIVNTGQFFLVKDYNIEFNDKNPYGWCKENNSTVFTVYYVNNSYTHYVPQIQIQCYKLEYQPVTFIKI